MENVTDMNTELNTETTQITETETTETCGDCPMPINNETEAKKETKDLRGKRYTPEQMNDFYQQWTEAGVTEDDFVKQTEGLTSRDALKKAILMNEGFLVKSPARYRRREEQQTISEFLQDVGLKEDSTLGKFSQMVADDANFALKSAVVKKLATKMITKLPLKEILMELEIDCSGTTMKELNQKLFGAEQVEAA